MTQTIKTKELLPNVGQIEGLPTNPRFIKDDKFEKLKNSIEQDPEMLSLREILVFPFEGKYVIIGGNMRYRAALDLGYKELPCKIIDKDTPVEKLKAYTMKDNIGYGEWDWDLVANEWDAQQIDDWGLDVWVDEEPAEGTKDKGLNSESQNGALCDRFIVPPFSVLDTRKGYWQARKKLWRERIGDNGESRQDTLISSLEIKYKDIYQSSREHRKELGITFREYVENYVSDEVKNREAGKVLAQGVSLLDPVMAELVCLWFGFENCVSFDPFAGDSIFGYVSSYLGNKFTGIELRGEQAAINNKRVIGLPAQYICDDGQNVAQHLEPESQDLMFSCPPYFDLEVYSDLENDASNQDSYPEFLKILENAFTASLACLKKNRFAVVVIGDVRDKKTGFYYNLVDDLKRIFKEQGASLYNELILIETGASTALRAGRYMDTRKVAKMHQNILVFYKGDTNTIKETYKKIEYASEDLEQFSVDFGSEPDED